MFTKLLKHLRNHKGDANVSKMVLIATVFVVGAILLVLVTSAFRNPINRWFDKVSNDWFASENGMYEADNAFLGLAKNANGTYQNVKYVRYGTDGSWCELVSVTKLTNGRYGDSDVLVQCYDANGRPGELMLYGGGTCTISDDGKTVTLKEWGTQVFVAQPPQ